MTKIPSSKLSKLGNQGPVVQSIVSLTKSLVNDSLSLLVRLKSSVLIFFAEKCEELLDCTFLAKNDSVFMYTMFEILTSLVLNNWAQDINKTSRKHRLGAPRIVNYRATQNIVYRATQNIVYRAT